MKRTLFNKDLFIESTNNGLDFYLYVIPHLESNDDGQYKNTYNPFYDDTEPSLRVYYDSNKEKWLFYDHGDPSFQGDVFDFAAHHYNMDVRKDFRTIMVKMAEDLKLELETQKPQDQMPSHNFEYSEENLWTYGFELCYSGSDYGLDDAYNFFSKYGITRDILKEYLVRSISSYRYLDKSGKVQDRFNRKGTFVAAYYDLEFIKFYRPDPKGFWYVGKKPKEYIFGMDQIERRLVKQKIDRDTLVIVGGEKDVLTLASMGFDAVCFNSETANVPKRASDLLFHWYKRIIVLYDTDETGKKQALDIVNKHANQFNILAYELPKELTDLGGKDISDYVEKGLDIDIIKNDLLSLEESNITLNPSIMDVSPSSGLNEPAIKEAKGHLPYQGVECNTHTYDSISNVHIIEDVYENVVKNTLIIPSSIKKNLPLFIQEIISDYSDERQCDMALTSLLCVLSGMMNTTSGVYHNSVLFPALCSMITASSGSGKSVIENVRKLFLPLHSDLLVRKGSHSGLFLSDYITTTSIVKHLHDSDGSGVLFSTDLGFLGQTLKRDGTGLRAIFRTAQSGETLSIEKSLKYNPVIVAEPKLASCLCAIPSEFRSLFSCIDDGLISRFIHYSFIPKKEWIDIKGGNIAACKQKQEKTRAQIADIHNYIKNRAFEFSFTTDQLQYINTILSKELQKAESSENWEAVNPIIKRLGHVIFKLSMVIATLRAWENNTQGEELAMTNDDLAIVVDLALVYFQHAATIINYVENNCSIEDTEWQLKEFTNKLPDNTFKRKEAIEAVKAAGTRVSDRTVDNWLKRAVEQGYLYYEYNNYSKIKQQAA